MRLRTKVIIIILVTWAVMFAITYIGSERVLGHHYGSLERQYAIKNINRVEEIIESMMTEVNTMNASWAIWDDTYNFVNDKNERFVNSNAPLYNFIASDVDAVFIFDRNDKPILMKMTNPERTQFIPIPKELYEHLTLDKKLLKHESLGSKVNGFIALPNYILIVSALPVRKSDNSGPINGTIMMGRYFNDTAIKRIIDISKLTVSFLPIAQANATPELQKIVDELKNQKGPAIEKSEDELFGYILLKDIYDQPIALMKINMPRTVYRAQINTIHYFTIMFLSTGVIFVFMLIFLIQKTVVKRLEKLSRQIINIGNTKAFSQRFPIEGSDEITSVNIEANKMLDIIQENNEQQQKLIDKVSEAEQFLKNVVNFMPSAIVIADENLKILLINPLAEKEMGLSDQAVKGQSLTDVFSYLNKYKNMFTQSLENNKPQIINEVTYKIEKEIRYFRVVIYPLQRGKHKLLVTRIDDITEQINLESKLSQQDKLASIGILTAGVAHEINNPVNFILGAITPLQGDIKDIISVIKKYEDIQLGKDIGPQLTEVGKYKQEIDINYTIEETNKLLEAIKEGAARTSTIVKDLKVFARMDEDVIKPFNLHEAIDSTLTLLKNNYKNRIEIVKEYGDIPEVDCFPGKLNQVFMNIISNAIDAIPDKGEIKIKTMKTNGEVQIAIEDTGPGMSEETKKKIFEPFFTTKPVGKGTGLGLSISFGIIRDHHGHIDVASELGKGTKFTITIPIKHTATKD